MKIINDTFSCGIRTVIAKPEGVCSQAIELKIFGDEILDVAFYGGCNGNLKGIAALAKGQKISDVKQRLTGMRTVRITQGLGGLMPVQSEKMQANATVSNLSELLMIF